MHVADHIVRLLFHEVDRRDGVRLKLKLTNKVCASAGSASLKIGR